WLLHTKRISLDPSATAVQAFNPLAQFVNLLRRLQVYSVYQANIVAVYFFKLLHLNGLELPTIKLRYATMINLSPFWHQIIEGDYDGCYTKFICSKVRDVDGETVNASHVFKLLIYKGIHISLKHNCMFSTILKRCVNLNTKMIT